MLVVAEGVVAGVGVLVGRGLGKGVAVVVGEGGGVVCGDVGGAGLKGAEVVGEGVEVEGLGVAVVV